MSRRGGRNSVVVGIGMTAFGSFPETDANGLAKDAPQAAIEEAGMSRAEVDALITVRVPAHWRFCELSGLDPDRVIPLPPFRRMTRAANQLAADLIADGDADVVLLAYGNDGRSRRVRYGGSDSEADQGLWRAWGMTFSRRRTGYPHHAAPHPDERWTPSIGAQVRLVIGAYGSRRIRLARPAEAKEVAS